MKHGKSFNIGLGVLDQCIKDSWCDQSCQHSKKERSYQEWLSDKTSGSTHQLHGSDQKALREQCDSNGIINQHDHCNNQNQNEVHDNKPDKTEKESKPNRYYRRKKKSN